MPETTDPKPSSPDSAATPPQGIPPLEASPEFQTRTESALGGPPTSPSAFAPIAFAPQPADLKRREEKEKDRPHDPAFDGPSPELIQARGTVASLAPLLSGIRTALDLNLADAKAAVAAIEADPLAKGESDLQGINLRNVKKFLSILENAQAKDAE